MEEEALPEGVEAPQEEEAETEVAVGSDAVHHEEVLVGLAALAVEEAEEEEEEAAAALVSTEGVEGVREMLTKNEKAGVKGFIFFDSCRQYTLNLHFEPKEKRKKGIHRFYRPRLTNRNIASCHLPFASHTTEMDQERGKCQATPTTLCPEPSLSQGDIDTDLSQLQASLSENLMRFEEWGHT